MINQNKHNGKMNYAILLLLVDSTLWIGSYLILTKITGSHSYVSESVIILPILILVLGLKLIGGYSKSKKYISLDYASEHIIACALSYAVAIFAVYFIALFGNNIYPSRGIFTSSMVIFTILSLLYRRFLWLKNKNSYEIGRFLVIADAVYAPSFYLDYIKSRDEEFVHFVKANNQIESNILNEVGGPPLKESLANFILKIKSSQSDHYDAIIVAADFSQISNDVVSALGIINFSNLPVYNLTNFYEKQWGKIPLHNISPAWPLEAKCNLVGHSVFSSIKRVLDFSVALVALIVLSPLLLVVSVAIRLFDGKPIIFSQQRIGLHGIPFKIYKFRSMSIGSERGDIYTQKNDSRVTRIGAILRKTRIDELPQLWNVIRGDLSLIGPRAEWERCVNEYEVKIPFYHFRHLVRPGISGWAQVNYPYGASLDDTLEKLSYDLYYIRNFSLRLDASVFLKTLHVILFGKGQ
jgi:exopolysaccharide biosynthesis polyprenyl glycosylphosphotransferase